MNRFLGLFVILAFLGVVAISCHNSSDPAVPEPKGEVASTNNPTEAGDSDVQEYVGEGTTPDRQLLQPMMQFRELDRVEAEFGKPEWSDAKLFNYEDIQFIMVPITSIRQDEFHCLVASPVEGDLCIFVMSTRGSLVVPLEEDSTQTDTDEPVSLEGSMTFVHGPGLDKLLFVKIDDSSVDRVSSLYTQALCALNCFNRFSLSGLMNCLPYIKACLKHPFITHWPSCVEAVKCIMKYYANNLGPLIQCIKHCFGWSAHALKPTQS